MIDTLLKIEESLLEAYALTRSQTRFGPIVALVDHGYPDFWANYGIISTQEPIQPEHLEAFRAYMEASDRIPRFEYREAISPDFAQMLEAAGYQLERADPVMTLQPSDVIRLRVRDGLTAEVLSSSNVREFLSSVSRAFDGDAEVSEDRCVETLRRSETGSQTSVLVRCHGVAAGGASLVLGKSVAELAGVGTAPEFRRRGVAPLASQMLCEKFFANGGELVWLSAGDSTAVATYESLGFVHVGRQLNYSLPKNKTALPIE